jgi:hypothetical protein
LVIEQDESGRWRPNHEVTEANARLIASSPELLEACNLALATIERLHPTREFDSTKGTKDVIAAAIAKATNPNAGEAQAYPAGRWTGGAK